MKNLVVMITGGAKGIGRSCAEVFLEAGFSVSLISRTSTELENTARELLKAYPGKVSSLCGDISDPSIVKDWFLKTKKELGVPSALINNASIFLNKPLAEQSLEEWEQVIKVNLNGSFLCAQALFNCAKESPTPKSIVNISSLAGIRGTEKFPGLSSYVASKFAVVGLTEALAVEGRHLGIRVNCIAPGAVDTEMLRKALPSLKAKAVPRDIAKIAYFLCDPSQAGVLTGSTIEVFSNA
jgi:meso-butanediol dehydrogenase/(S,S)-butanediol dehydrogenase/diacetyl reductase